MPLFNFASGRGGYMFYKKKFGYIEFGIHILFFSLRDYSPAGGLCSSSRDLSKWLVFLLGNGTSENGLSLIEKDLFDDMFEPSVSLPRGIMDRYSLETPYPLTSIASWYGYAWFGRNYRGKLFFPFDVRNDEP
jgi:CubicO group peptidase (beta-lactamase class C family)